MHTPAPILPPRRLLNPRRTQIHFLNVFLIETRRKGGRYDENGKKGFYLIETLSNKQEDSNFGPRDEETGSDHQESGLQVFAEYKTVN